jgi:hypothetical protein
VFGLRFFAAGEGFFFFASFHEHKPPKAQLQHWRFGLKSRDHAPLFPTFIN